VAGPYKPSPTRPIAQSHPHNQPLSFAAVGLPASDSCVTVGVGVEDLVVVGDRVAVEDLVALGVKEVYGTVDDPATRYVALVGTTAGTAVEEAWRLLLRDWKPAEASAAAVAWMETRLLVVSRVEVRERVEEVETTSIEMYISIYQ